MLLDNTSLHTVLSALGDQITLYRSEPLAIVVCGGSALQALNLVSRTTRDVDVLAIARPSLNTDETPILLTAEPLPVSLTEAARDVAHDFGLPTDWLNSGPTDLLTEGLPDGCAKRLHTFSYGSHLTVHFIDRVDQICFKTYAAINGDAPRHLADLRALQPSDAEMLTAARWTLTQDAADFYPDYLRDFLRKVGFSLVADQL